MAELENQYFAEVLLSERDYSQFLVFSNIASACLSHQSNKRNCLLESWVSNFCWSASHSSYHKLMERCKQWADKPNFPVMFPKPVAELNEKGRRALGSLHRSHNQGSQLQVMGRLNLEGTASTLPMRHPGSLPTTDTVAVITPCWQDERCSQLSHQGQRTICTVQEKKKISTGKNRLYFHILPALQYEFQFEFLFTQLIRKELKHLLSFHSVLLKSI